MLQDVACVRFLQPLNVVGQERFVLADGVPCGVQHRPNGDDEANDLREEQNSCAQMQVLTAGRSAYPDANLSSVQRHIFRHIWHIKLNTRYEPVSAA